MNQACPSTRGNSTTTIYWFSGTGNSLHLARALSERLPDCELVPIVAQLAHKSIIAPGGAVGFVFPLHGLTVPIAVDNLLRRVDLSKAAYLFALVNRGGSICRAFDRIDRLLSRQSRALDASFLVNMPNNDPKLEAYEQLDAAQIAEIESAAMTRLDEIATLISARAPHRETGDDGVGFDMGPVGDWLMEKLVLLGMAVLRLGTVRDYFETNNKCVGCGICAQVCPSEKIRMIDGRPIWRPDVTCYFCYACLNYCPSQAVQIKSKWYMRSFTAEHGRYLHPFADIDDIATQKPLFASHPPHDGEQVT